MVFKISEKYRDSILVGKGKSIEKIISNIEDTDIRRKAAYLHANKNFSREKMAKSYLEELSF